MAERPSGLNPSDIHQSRELSLANFAFFTSATIPFLGMGREIVRSLSEQGFISSQQRVTTAGAMDLNLPIAAGLMAFSAESNSRTSRAWTRLALAEGLVGAAGDILLHAGLATGQPEMIAAGATLSAGSYAAEAIQAATMMFSRLNTDPREARNVPPPTLPLATL